MIQHLKVNYDFDTKRLSYLTTPTRARLRSRGSVVADSRLAEVGTSEVEGRVEVPGVKVRLKGSGRGQVTDGEQARRVKQWVEMGRLWVVRHEGRHVPSGALVGRRRTRRTRSRRRRDELSRCGVCTAAARLRNAEVEGATVRSEDGRTRSQRMGQVVPGEKTSSDLSESMPSLHLLTYSLVYSRVSKKSQKKSDPL